MFVTGLQGISGAKRSQMLLFALFKKEDFPAIYHQPLCIDNVQIASHQCFKYLGIIFTTDGSWSSYITKSCKILRLIYMCVTESEKTSHLVTFSVNFCMQWRLICLYPLWRYKQKCLTFIHELFLKKRIYIHTPCIILNARCSFH